MIGTIPGDGNLNFWIVWKMKIHQLINNIENNKTHLIYFIITFFAASSLRIFLEGGVPSLNTFLHFTIWFAFTGIGITLIISFISKEKVFKVIKTVSSLFLIIVTPVLFDLILSGGKGFAIGYLRPGFHSDLLMRFFTFFGQYDGFGITPGIKIEVMLVLFATFIYVNLKTNSLLRSSFSVLFVYIFIFINCSLPFYLRYILELLSLNYLFTQELMINSLSLLLLVSLIIFAALNKRAYLSEIVKDIRVSRLVYYILLFVIGILISIKLFYYQLDYKIENISVVFYSVISIIGAWVFSVITNNLTDKDIDKISNKDRPTITNSIPSEQYKKISWIILLITLIYASLASFKVFFLISVFMGSYFIYSMPPLRLKRVPLFSKLVIALNSLACFLVGFTILGDIHVLSKLDIMFDLLLLTAAANFIDLKDYLGDKREGINTLPVLFGLKKSKLLIGLFFIITYTLTGRLFNNLNMLLLLTLLGIIQFLLINRKKYDERPILITLLVSLLIVITYFVYI